MAEVAEEHVDDPGEALDLESSGPLLRDPPPPPGYTNPVEENELLEEPFAPERWSETRPEEPQVAKAPTSTSQG